MHVQVLHEAKSMSYDRFDDGLNDFVPNRIDLETRMYTNKEQHIPISEYSNPQNLFKLKKSYFIVCVSYGGNSNRKAISLQYTSEMHMLSA